MPHPTILVYDSGLGGLSVMRALATALPRAPFVYVADTAGFPYGNRAVEDLAHRADAVIHAASRAHEIALVVVACNTISTLCLEGLRQRHALPFVGTVPAIKLAASVSVTKRFTVLATPRSAHSRYTAELIEAFAGGCVVDVVGAPRLALLAEAALLGESVSDGDIAAEITPCFYDDERGKTDTLVLGCTHYPFLAEAIAEQAPWEVTLVDPAEAVARQAARLWNAPADTPTRRAYVTDAASATRYGPVFARFGFMQTGALDVSIPVA